MNTAMINKNKLIHTFLIVTISFLHLMVFENELYGAADYSNDAEQINIEVVYKPKLHQELSSSTGTSLLKQKKSCEAFYKEKKLKCRNRLQFSINEVSNRYIKNQKNFILSFHPIVSILQMKNAWHQTSNEDDPSITIV